MQDEEHRLDRGRQVDLDDYEETLNKQHAAELRRKQQQLEMTKDTEEKELEIMKLRLDQQFQEKTELFHKKIQAKYFQSSTRRFRII